MPLAALRTRTRVRAPSSRTTVVSRASRRAKSSRRAELGLMADRIKDSQKGAEVRISSANGTSREVDAVTALSRLIDRDGMARFTYTRQVRIDEDAPISFSHPVLTLRPDHILGPPEPAVLTVYVHEQMHWAANTLAGTVAAIDEARRRWPRPPSGAEGGARDDQSTWLHFPVCALEIATMTDLFDEATAVTTVRSLPWYRWIYEQLTGDSLPWRDFLNRHAVVLPAEPPRRAIDLPWVLSADVEQLRVAVGELLDLFSDVPLARDVVVRIVASCCLNLEALDAQAATRIDPRNHDVYPVLEGHRGQVDVAIRRLRKLQNP
jgi:hypothetical protein